MEKKIAYVGVRRINLIAIFFISFVILILGAIDISVNKSMGWVLLGAGFLGALIVLEIMQNSHRISATIKKRKIVKWKSEDRVI
jgi:hypothetical protein